MQWRMRGTIGHYAVYPSATTNTAFRRDYMTTRFLGQNEVTRMRVFSAYAKIGGPLVGDGSLSQMDYAKWSGGNALALMSHTARSAGGIVYANTAGGLTYRNLNTVRETGGAGLRAVYQAHVPQSGMPDGGLEFVTGLDRIINEVQVTMRFIGNEIKRTYRNPVSVEEYGVRRREFDLDTLWQSEEEAREWAYSVLDVYDSPTPVCDGVRFDLGARFRAWDSVLCLDIADRFRVATLPPHVIESGYLDLRVEQITHTVDMQGTSPTWTVDIKTAPVEIP